MKFVARVEPPKPLIVLSEVKQIEPQKLKSKKGKNKKESVEKNENNTAEEMNKVGENKTSILMEEKSRKLLRPLGKETESNNNSKKKITEAVKAKEEAPQRVIEKKKKAPLSSTSKPTVKKAVAVESDAIDKSEASEAVLNVIDLDLDSQEDPNETKKSVKFKDNSLSHFPIRPLTEKPPAYRLEKTTKPGARTSESLGATGKPVSQSSMNRIDSFSEQPNTSEAQSNDYVSSGPKVLQEAANRKNSVNEDLNEKEQADKLNDADATDSQTFNVMVKKAVNNTPEPIDENEWNRLRQKSLYEFVSGFYGAPIRLKSAQYRLPLFNSKDRKPPNLQNDFDAAYVIRKKKQQAAPSVDSYVPQTFSQYFTKWLVHYNLKQISQAERHERVRDNSACITNSNLDRWYYSIDKKQSKRPISAAFAFRRELGFSSTPPDSAPNNKNAAIMMDPRKTVSSSSKRRVDYAQLNKSSASIPAKRRPITTSVAITNRPPPSTPNLLSKKDNDSEMKSEAEFIHVQPTYMVSQIEMEEIIKEVNFRVEVFSMNVNSNRRVESTGITSATLGVVPNTADVSRRGESREWKINSHGKLIRANAKSANSGIEDIIIFNEASENEA